jgi:putative phage-type endonuclease
MHPKVSALLRQPQWAQRTPEWYEIRRTLLTASDVASALDIKPYASYKGSPRADLLTKKLENRPFGNMFTAHGQKYEDEARDLMASVLGETVLDFGLLVHPVETWLAASPDGVTTTGKCVEIKCPLKRTIVPGKVPSHYWPQVQVQMQVCGMDSTLFVQYKPAHMNPDRKPFIDIAVVERDDAWFADNLPRLKAFYEEYIAAMQTYVASPTLPEVCRIVDDLYSGMSVAHPKKM